jgi:hypothetical protein
VVKKNYHKIVIKTMEECRIQVADI